ncbi:MAG: ParB/RepB/Spo0J family partition protein [Gemmataceae bacterium]|nr:ParB/RepB/Spo0J family partition protein [Gemmataceae bacterium]
MRSAETLKRKFGANLSESLGVRTQSQPAAPPPPVVAAASPDHGRTRAREAGHMEIEQIVPDPNQPRKEFDPDALDRLAQSLQKHGQLLPVRVRWDAALGRWVIISGERRYQAAKRAGMKTLACVFIDKELTPGEILQEQVIENLLREDLRPLEQAKAYQTLMGMQGWNGSQLAEALHISKATVSRVLTLLKLPEDVRERVDRGEIPSTAAYEVAKLPTDDARREMAGRIVAEGMNRRDAVEAVREVVDQTDSVPLAVPEALSKFRHETPAIEQVAQTVSSAADGEDVGHTPSPPPAAPVLALDDRPEAQSTLIGGQDVPVRKKPGKPRGGSKERSYRVEVGARVTISFPKKVPTADEVVTAIEQALTRARSERDRAEAA